MEPRNVTGVQCTILWNAAHVALTASCLPSRNRRRFALKRRPRPSLCRGHATLCLSLDHHLDRCAEAIAHAEPYGVRLRVDALPVELARRAAWTRRIDAAEIEEHILRLDRPAPVERPFGAAADRPAEHRLAAV